MRSGYSLSGRGYLPPFHSRSTREIPKMTGFGKRRCRVEKQRTIRIPAVRKSWMTMIFWSSCHEIWVTAVMMCASHSCLSRPRRRQVMLNTFWRFRSRIRPHMPRGGPTWPMMRSARRPFQISDTCASPRTAGRSPPLFMNSATPKSMLLFCRT